MKHIKSYILLTWMAVSLVGCKVDDLKDDVNDLKNRVALIEEQVKILNDNVEVMAYVLDTQQKTISKVEPSADKSQFTITLSDGYTMTLTVGKAGEVVPPTISVDENGYWVVNGLSTGVKAVGEDGTTPDYPEFQVKNGEWQFRFGEDGEWKPVEGGNIGGGSLGDQIFESAKVDGDKFVITLANDGGTYELPIVSQLSCEINKDMVGADGYIEFQPGETKTFKVKITGTPLAPVYPSGWRAELEKLDSADENGYNYQLVVYAPEQTSASSLANVVASNISEISVRVNKDVFWAVDKIKVCMEVTYNSLKEKYEAGQAIEINGFSINMESFGAVKQIPDNNTISEDGVYFVENSTSDMVLNASSGINQLVLISESDNKPTLKINSIQTLNGSLLLANVIIDVTANSTFVFDVASDEGNVIINQCDIVGLKLGKGLVTSSNGKNLGLFSIYDSNIKLIDSDANSVNLYLLEKTPVCKKYDFENNIVAYQAGENVAENVVGDKAKLTNFKLFNNNNGCINELILKKNTFIDIRTYTIGSNNKASMSGLVLVKYIGSETQESGGKTYSNDAMLHISNNIYYLSISSDKFSSMFVKYTIYQIGGNIDLRDNIAYAETAGFKYFYTSGTDYVAPEGVTNNYPSLKKEGIFDTGAGATYDFENFKFIPATQYQSYGAQRK